ncbi:MAG: hypothetical protein HXX08_01735 [Chloroflexi bacterium]|uniref:Uncharacterized protein n=1 Tax=Candidatus Chlorohelix allophototropha TaxID=3003348 RepID=A0A8T7M2G1_9CHLR|nr:hypothetical protein [Chloroflexota bacterium]WJW66466.1 hypothetical protein OZ401_002267 [Chloroflexota bacterium L227-S17]
MQETKKIFPGIILGLLAILIFNFGISSHVMVKETPVAEVQTASVTSLEQLKLFSPLRDFKLNAPNNAVSQPNIINSLPVINLPGTNTSLGISEGAHFQDREK